MNLQQCLNQPANTIEWKTVEEDLLTTAAPTFCEHTKTPIHTNTRSQSSRQMKPILNDERFELITHEYTSE